MGGPKMKLAAPWSAAAGISADWCRSHCASGGCVVLRVGPVSSVDHSGSLPAARCFRSLMGMSVREASHFQHECWIYDITAVAHSIVPKSVCRRFIPFVQICFEPAHGIEVG